jgi:NhaA family Na+:H+ antiporter
MGAGCLGGMGFTMALFVASLALKNPTDLEFGKVGILKGSLLSAVLGLLILHFHLEGEKSNRAS